MDSATKSTKKPDLRISKPYIILIGVGCVSRSTDKHIFKEIVREKN